MRIRPSFGPVVLAVDTPTHDLWIGVGWLQVGLRDHRKIPPLFSERYKHFPSISKRCHYLHIGSWCLHIDTNWMNRRINRRTA